MKIILKFIILSLLIISCASENEQKALGEIADIYGATTSYSKNFQSANGKTIKEFNVKVSNSIMLDSLPKAPAASNIAVVTFNNLNEKEKNSYNAINVFLITQKKDTTKFHYDIAVLKNAAPKAKVFNDFSNNIVDKNFAELDKYKDNETIPQSINAFMKQKIAEREKLYGTLKQFKPSLIIQPKNKQRLQFVGLLIFDNGKAIRYYTIFDKAKGKDKIRGIQFFK